MKIQRWAPGLYALLLAVHAAVLVAQPGAVLLVSYAVVLALFALTLCLCWRRGTISVPHNRPFWRVLLLVMCFKAIAYVLLTLDAWTTPEGTLVAVDPAFYFCAAAVLAVLATTYMPGVPSSRWTSLLDGILVLALAWQFYDLLHAQVLPSAQAQDTAHYLIAMFDSMDLFVAVFATLRLLASRRADERRFFFVLAAYTWVDALCAGAHNRLILVSDSYLTELLHDVPLVVMGVLLSSRKVMLDHYRPARWVINAVAGLVPFALSFALCLLALQRSATSLSTTRAMVMLAIMAYGLRNALLLAGYLAGEDERRRLRRELQASVFRDDLTGLANRRGLDRQCQRAWERALETGQPLAIAMMDIDRFKEFNDAHGHQAGDDCLAAVGAALRFGMQDLPGVSVGRYGGEEFLVLLEGHDTAQALRTVESLRRMIDDLRIAHEGVPGGIVSASAGCASATAGRYESIDHLVGAADKALYAAKAAGRGRLQAASDLD